jgi:phosphatidylglycerol:prolipoprotein diacylglycerol transferase
LPWAVSFPPGSQPHDQQLLHGSISAGQAALPLHPTQLYEALFGLALFGFLIVYRKRQRREGELIALLFLGYSFGRFFFEFLRGDDRWIAFGMSVPQYLSILGVGITATFLLAGRTHAKGATRVYAKKPEPELEVQPVTAAQPVG